MSAYLLNSNYALGAAPKNDWPATWRDAPSVYLTSYSRGRGRALRLFGAVVKELARQGPPRDRRVLREDAALLLPDVAAA